jgi:S1-C subfamily serine protease
MSLIPPTFLDCVVAVGYRREEGSVAYSATGFLYGHYHPPKTDAQEAAYTVFLATNRHVLSGKKSIVLRFNAGPDRPAREFDALLITDEGKQLWIGHDDPTIDVGVVLLKVKMLQENDIPIALFGSDKHALFHDSELAQNLSEGNGVFILGFPMGLVGEQRNCVIVRGGCIARIRDSLAGTSKTFLVDAFIFPGNSGGPVVVRPEIVAITGTMAITTASLIGMVSSYLPYQDSHKLSDQTTTSYF